MAGREYSLGVGVKAETVYNRLAGKRTAVVDMGRLMAELTIPSAFPPEGYSTGDDIPGNNQSEGAQCVNSLTSKLMFLAFPPNQPICRFTALEYMIQPEVDKDPQLWAATQLALARLEISHRQRLQSTTIAAVYGEYLKTLIIAGNALWKHLKLNHPTTHRPDCYVVKRNKVGQPLLIIHEESLNLAGMDPDHRAFIEAVADENAFEGKDEWEKEVTVYSCQKSGWDGEEQVWHYWEEYDGHTLPDTEVTTDYDTPPMMAGWLIPMFGQDWGQGYCEQYRGDLYTLEAHASAINDGSALAALSLMFVKPGTPSSIKQIREAKNLSMLPGSAEDLSVFRSDKTADLNFVVNNAETVARRLDAAFLRQFAIQRNGERVTAEEIRRLGQELDKSTGGLYTLVAQGSQKPIIVRAIRLNEEENPKLPELPKGLVEVQVITGMDALGDSTEYDATVETVGTAAKLFPVAVQQQVDVGNFLRRLMTFRGVKPDGLVKSPEAVAAEVQQQKQEAISSQLLDKATGPAIKGVADFAKQQGGLPQLPAPEGA